MTTPPSPPAESAEREASAGVSIGAHWPRRPGAVTGYLDYTVPDGATRFSARIGIDRQSPNTSARVEFSVLDVDGRVLKKESVTYQKPGTIDVPVSGLPRVRLKIALLKSDGELSYTHHLRVAWITPAFL
ncbi:NPCBM/NEW2 domain-containing protein [Nonomuraea sp. NPDC050783]|uniref:NPCBM/NEW2 domain-containing protein n=1 Tax=Nonomuraea sp. NPDC050783 TaxID=3154634 RepID=UPI0034663D58